MTFDTGTRFVYMLSCRDGTIYTGKTKNLFQRIHEHNTGKVRYTRGRRPITLVWANQCNKTEAARLERKIKRMSKAKKLEMIKTQVRL